MVRQDLITRCTQSLQQSVCQKRTIITDSLYAVTQCLEDSSLQEIKNFISQASDSSWKEVQRQDYLARKSINWQSDTVIEELHIAIDAVTPLIKDLFGGALHFHGIQLWRDSESYNLPYHFDNTIIDCALQIYLFDSPRDQGTTFVYQGHEHTIDFENNSGYLVSNRPGRALMHRTTGVVPTAHQRYTLFAYWSLCPKAQ